MARGCSIDGLSTAQRHGMIIGIAVLATTLMAPRADLPVARQLLKLVEAADVKTPVYRIVTLDLDPQGNVISCEPGDGKGDEASMAQACTLASQLRYNLTANVDGQPAYGRSTTIVAAYENDADRPRIRLPPDLVLEVDEIPDDVKDHLDVDVSLLVSPGGSIERCEPTGERHRNYAEIACARVFHNPAPMMQGPEGTTVSYVDMARIRFVKGGGHSGSVDQP